MPSTSSTVRVLLASDAYAVNTEPLDERAITSKLNEVPANLVYSRPVLESESFATAALATVSVQLKSATQVALLVTKAQDVEPPKLQVVAPASAGVVVVLNVVVPVVRKLMGVTLAVLLPADMVKAPRFGMDARLPACVSVPAVRPAVYAVVSAASAHALMVIALFAQVLPLAGPWIW